MTRINEEDIHFEKLIGSGLFGDVFLGQMIIKNCPINIKIAIKVKFFFQSSFQFIRFWINSLKKKYKFNLSNQNKNELLLEAILLKSCNHTNLVKLYGACFKKDETLEFIAMEYMNRGNLLDHLRNSRNLNVSNYLYSIVFEKKTCNL